MTIADVDTMYWCVIRPKVSSVPRQKESPEDGFGRRLTSETGSVVSFQGTCEELTRFWSRLQAPHLITGHEERRLSRSFGPVSGFRHSVMNTRAGIHRRLPRSSQPSERVPRTARDTLNNPSARLNFLCVELQSTDLFRPSLGIDKNRQTATMGLSVRCTSARRKDIWHDVETARDSDACSGHRRRSRGMRRGAGGDGYSGRGNSAARGDAARGGRDGGASCR